MKQPERVVAIDWSGNKSLAGQRQHIWIADCHHGNITLTAGRTRQEVCNWLLAAAAETPELFVGLDFAFSFPAWFVQQKGGSAPAFWQQVAWHGESWLAACAPPFWGRPGKRRPLSTPETVGFRRTDADLAMKIAGIQPKSPLQIGGAGAVGTGSLRGIPLLLQLRDAGFSIWPFHAPRMPIAVEIYPRLLTGPIRKSNAEARKQYLQQPQYRVLPAHLKSAAVVSEDAFDALVSVVAMHHTISQKSLPTLQDPVILLEGKIWNPNEPDE